MDLKRYIYFDIITCYNILYRNVKIDFSAQPEDKSNWRLLMETKLKNLQT